MAVVRLDKYLANAGCGTRTQVKKLLKDGLVRVNDMTVTDPAMKIQEETDLVICRGQAVSRDHFIYLMLNKPAGLVTATRDRKQETVLDLIPPVYRKDLFPAGRLDIDTEGLLLLTNDGALGHHLLSPRHHVDKTYYARIRGRVTDEDIARFSEGLDIGEEKPTMSAVLTIVKDGTGEGSAAEGQDAWDQEVTVTIQEGKYHQVKRMFEAVGKQVVYLKRLSMGSLHLDADLKPGEYRLLTAAEVRSLEQGMAARARTQSE